MARVVSRINCSSNQVKLRQTPPGVAASRPSAVFLMDSNGGARPRLRYVFRF